MFEWYTVAACDPKSSLRKAKQVPCYIYDKEGRKIDLSPLSKTKGGYLVEQETGQSPLYINVCRDIEKGILEK